MFVLVAMKDLLEIPPWKFKEELVDTVTNELNKKLANKVLVGLLASLAEICLWVGSSRVTDWLLHVFMAR